MTYEVRDNVEKGLYRLPTQFDDTPLLRDYLATYLTQVDGVQTLSEAVLEGMRIDTAIGVQLDSIGKIVGESRKGRADAEYRVAIRAKIVVNASQGTPTDIINAAKALSSSPNVRVWEHYPATVMVAVGGEDLINIPQNIAEDLDNAAAAGVSVPQVMVDTNNQSLVFSELLFESGDVVLNDLDNLVDDLDNNIGYQIASGTTLNGQTSFFAEIIAANNLVSGADQLILNGDDWVVTTGEADDLTGNIFFEVLT